MKIFTIVNKKEEKFLRQKTAKFDFNKYTKKETAELVKQMRGIMTEAIGIGLSANQLGLDLRLFVAQLPQIGADKTHEKFYAIFNPEIIKFSEKKVVMEEGCLSVPGVYGLVERPEKITLVGQDRYSKKIKIKAWGLLARIFQHEVDHLNGVLFVDRTKNIRKLDTHRNS